MVTDSATIAALTTQTALTDNDIANYGNDLGASQATAKPSTPATKTTTTTASKPNNAAVTAEAIKYLDDNKAWTREKLESFACLAGLYDDMNNLRIDDLINTWGPKLKNSKNFERVVKHAKQGRKRLNSAQRSIPVTTPP